MRWAYVAAVAFILGGILLLKAPSQVDRAPDGMWEATVGPVVDKTQKKLLLIEVKQPAASGQPPQTASDNGRVTPDKAASAGEAVVPLLATLNPGDQVFYKAELKDQPKSEAAPPKSEAAPPKSEAAPPKPEAAPPKPDATPPKPEAKEQVVTITALALKQYNLGYVGALGALLIAFSLIWAAILVVTGGHPWAFALGLDFRLSNSQTQVYLWFLVFATVYLADLGLRFGCTDFLGGIGAPAKLLALSGVSALTFGAARVSTTIKENANTAANANLAAGEAPKPVKQPERGNRSGWQHFRDLVTNDHGGFDLGDFQMIALTALAVLLYLGISVVALAKLAFAAHVDLPGVDDTLLGGTAATQGAYLLKKFGSPPGH